MARNDNLEPSAVQSISLEEPLSVHDQARIGLARQILGAVVETDPGRSHDIGVDVIQKIVNRQIFHRQIELTGKLTANQFRILGQEQDSLARGQMHCLWWLHR